MKIRLFIFFILAMLSTSTLQAQTNRGMDAKMRDFINTPFMEQYQKIQLKMVRQIRLFMLEQGKYSATDVYKVKEAYTLTSKAFNEVLLEIKKDFLDKKTRKVIKDAPDLYQAKLEMELIQLKDIYANTFLQTLSDVKGEQVDGGVGFLLVITEWTKFTFYVVDFFTQLRWKNTMFNDAFLRDRLIRPYSFPSWNALLMQNTPGGMMNNGFEGMGNDMMMNGMNGMDMNGMNGIDMNGMNMNGMDIGGEMPPNLGGMPPGNGGGF